MWQSELQDGDAARCTCMQLTVTCYVMMHVAVHLCAGGLSTHQMLDALQSGGEEMSKDELHAVLQELTGAEEPTQVLPSRMDARVFACELLGLAV